MSVRPLLVVAILFAVLTLGVSSAASGSGDQAQVVTPSWTDCQGYLVETLARVISACRPAPEDYHEIAVAADGSIVGSGTLSVGSTAPVTMLRPAGQVVQLDASPNDFDPAISYDGSKVAFARWNQQTGASDIYTVNADGSDLQLVASGQGKNKLMHPEFSPDGGTIAYTCQPALSGPGGGDANCGPLLDGTYRTLGVLLMNADGSDKRMILISNGGLTGSLSWSPDGRWLAMVGALGTGGQVLLYRTDGSDLFNDGDPSRQVTHETDPQSPIQPQFSPDGTQILFMTVVDDNGTEGNFSYIVNRDGTNRHEVLLSPDPITCTNGVCSGHQDWGVFVPPATGGGPAPTVNATRVTVPGVRTLSYRAASHRLLAAHLTPKLAGRRFSAIPRGHVLAQYPRQGSHMHRTGKKGPRVKLILSRGPRRR